MDGQDLVPNPERVECRICYVELDPGEGVLLRECLHCFCKWGRQRVCCCSRHIVTFIVLYCHAVVKRTLCVSVGRECLRSVILMSEDPQVACPYRDEAYACDCILQEREIRAVRSHSFIPLLFCLQKDCLVFTYGWEASVAGCRSLTPRMWHCPVLERTWQETWSNAALKGF